MLSTLRAYNVNYKQDGLEKNEHSFFTAVEVKKLKIETTVTPLYLRV